MTAAPNYVTRRATVEDLPQLISLWQLEQLPADVLEKHFTEFQVVSDPDGRVLAAIGMKVAGSQGLMHGESIAQPEAGDSLRELLWTRLQVMIHNHALERIWTKVNAPFWREKGFERATNEILSALPAAFQDEGSNWHVKTLRTAEASAAIEREFALMKSAQNEESARLKERVQWMKRVALGLTVIVFLLVVVWTIAMLKYGPKILHQK